ncbi:MAG TPA: HAMP domain-containing sensor histidine kinase [Patescibacteria group bacterium]|nr:HAMP domain-containing sensor histidine kinase [Patescibacteria group bacterium]
MLISILFSISLYRLQTAELEDGFRRLNFRYVTQQYVDHPEEKPQDLDYTYVENTEHKLLINLLSIDVVILVLSGFAGYLLAGITLRPIKKMLDEQNRFITDASHELRTPLTALRSEIEVNLRDKDLSLSSAKNLLKSNLEEVENLQKLSDNLLQLSNAEPNKNITVGTIEIAIVIQEAIKKITPQAKKKQISISFTPKNFLILAEKSDLVQLLIIFLDNAVKYSKKKTTVTIETRSTDHSCEITIADEGMGIEKKEIPHIFDRFYRVDSSRTKQTISGYGLGLSIAKKIVDSYKGSLSVKSEVGKGSTFRILLPIKKG